MAPDEEDFKEDTYCYLCDTYFCDQKSLQVHHEIEHANIKTEQLENDYKDNQELNCKICGEFFYYYSDLKSHVDSSHKGTNQSTFTWNNLYRATFRYMIKEAEKLQKDTIRNARESPSLSQGYALIILFIGAYL